MPRLDRALRALVERSTALLGDDVGARPLGQQRRAYLKLCRHYTGPRPDGLQVSDRTLVTDDHEIRLRIHRPGPAAPLPWVLFLHGGGWIWGNLDSHDDLCAQISDRTGAAVIAVDYRLAPEHRHPAALDDVAAVLQAVVRDPAAFGVHARPPLICGDSAGANLAAALALRSRDLGGPRLAGQALVYPVLADPTRDGANVDGAPFDDQSDMLHFWRCYVGQAAAPDPYAAPLLAKSLDGLPPTFVLTAQHDPLRADGEAYVQRLLDAGVPTQWHDAPGLIHGCLRVWRESRAVARALETLTAAIRDMLAR